MNLRAKKQLAANTLGVGKERIVFVNERIEEIKEAITKQDIRDLASSGAIIVKPAGGRRKNVKRKNKKGPGKIKKKVKKRKKDYVKMTRKLRKTLADKKRKGEIDRKEFKEIRKKIRNKIFKSKTHLKEYLGGSRNEGTKKKKKRK